MSVLLQGEEELKRAPQPRLALEVLLLRVIHLEPVLPLAEWLARLDTLEKRLESGLGTASAGAGERQARPVVPAAGEPVVTPAAPAPTPPGVSVDAGLDEQWQAFLQFVQEKENGPLYGKLAQCRLVERSDNCLKIAMARPWNANGARHEARVQEMARTFFGPETTLEFEVDAPKTPKKSPAAPKKPLDMQKLQQQALEIFGGEWISATPGKEEPE
jgi:DNA polymerase-3 subunit gamma/tau